MQKIQMAPVEVVEAVLLVVLVWAAVSWFVRGYWVRRGPLPGDPPHHGPASVPDEIPPH